MRTEKNIILIRHAKWLWDNKLKQQYQLLDRKGAVVKETKKTTDVLREEVKKVQQEIKEENGELFIKE